MRPGDPGGLNGACPRQDRTDGSADSGSLVFEGARETGRHLEGELFEGEGEVDRGDGHGLVDIEPSRREVEDPRDPGFDQGIGNLLGRSGGNRHDPELDLMVPNQDGQLIHAVNDSTAEFTADGAVTGVEDRRDVEVLLSEALVGEQSTADVPDADQRRIPGAIPPQHLPEMIVESSNLVADAGMTQLPEEGQVLSNLGTGQSKGGTQLFGAHGASPCSDQRPHLPEIQAESLDGGPGNLWFGLHDPSLPESPYNPVAMHIDDVFERDRTTFSFEFFPPQSAAGWSTLEATLESLELFQPSFVSVTYGAAGSTRERTHDLVRRLKQETPLDPAPHLTCMMHDPPQINAILEQYARSGISNLVAIRGDVPKDMHAEDVFKHFRHAADLVKTIRAFNDSGVHPDPRGFGICVAGFPEGHPETPNTLVQMDHLKAKVDAGANWICSQLFFDNNAFYDWCERCEIAGIRIPIIAGIMPITSIKGLKRMAELASGTRFPASLLRSMQRVQDDPEAVENVGTHWSTEQCRDLIDRKSAGIHFYTLNRSQATTSIFKTLGASDASKLRP